MKNNIGRMKCPVCGRNTWVRENKNGVLYTYCASLHHTKLNGEDSKNAKEALKQGKSWNNGLIYIYPNERTENDGNNTNTNGTIGTITRADIDGRPNGQPATPANRGTESDTESTDRIGIGCW